MASKKLFIVGGTGYIGGTVIEYAIKDGYTVRARKLEPPKDVNS
jgi:nucleoside-diphosphate-sugar epimerase